MKKLVLKTAVITLGVTVILALAAFGIVVSAVTIPLTVAFRKMLNKIGKRFE